MARAKVFIHPERAISSLDLSRPPNDQHPLDPGRVVDCRYVPKAIKATTPKFDCELPNGDVIKVKYGRTPERPGEAAATRLLAALGFGADHVTILPKIRCHGCPPFPFQMRRFAELFYAESLLERVTNPKAEREFTWVAAERKMDGRAIEVGLHEGWDWRELPLVDPAKGGATRAELDALRLTAIHAGPLGQQGQQPAAALRGRAGRRRSVRAVPHARADSSGRGRDVRADEGRARTSGPPCRSGPTKGAAWSACSRCRTTAAISRRFRSPRAAGRCLPDSSRSCRNRSFARCSSRRDFRIRPPAVAPGDVTAWVRTFQEKVRQIAQRPPCPSLAN